MKRNMSVVRFKFLCNILISVKIIKEMPVLGSEWDTLYLPNTVLGVAIFIFNFIQNSHQQKKRVRFQFYNIIFEFDVQVTVHRDKILL